ncbi:MAG: helicase [Microbacterium sp. 14-71-5]|jgi:secretion/DNA translocation related TadE-like protein|uniref:Rv3654c family TadE-like protein n=1 Tax=Microbacterium sp. 13-71-7 TaxID=1970399 RepID=UPI000BD75D85|nr:Rv3654c family TadE-like protein [Microbacterium sp. 13-71-7]OZB79895.1 MAG: helicase [Microbacterium sp. 14-71-5]OZB82258.1 MAG: helicase [Microbacterium sp. 13-71-7]
MAGSVLAIGGIAVVAAFGLGVAMVGGAGATSQRAAAAADAAALAAADAISGAIPVAEEPCALAARVALAHEAALQDCRIDGAVVIVHVAAAYAGFPAVAGSRAGPPELPAGDG